MARFWDKLNDDGDGGGGYGIAVLPADCRLQQPIFRRTHSPNRLVWSEGWRPPGAQSAFIKWTGWTLAMTISWWQHHKHCHSYYYYYTPAKSKSGAVYSSQLTVSTCLDQKYLVHTGGGKACWDDSCFISLILFCHQSYLVQWRCQPGHFEVRKSSSQVTRMHFFPQKKSTTFFSCQPQNTGRQRHQSKTNKAFKCDNTFIFCSHYYGSKAIRRAEPVLEPGLEPGRWIFQPGHLTWCALL